MLSIEKISTKSKYLLFYKCNRLESMFDKRFQDKKSMDQWMLKHKNRIIIIKFYKYGFKDITKCLN